MAGSQQLNKSINLSINQSFRDVLPATSHIKLKMKLLNQEWSMVPTTKQISHLINKVNLEPDLMNNENKLNPAVQLERQHNRNGSNKST